MTKTIIGEDYDWQLLNMIKGPHNKKMVTKITDRDKYLLRELHIKQKMW